MKLNGSRYVLPNFFKLFRYMLNCFDTQFHWIWDDTLHSTSFINLQAHLVPYNSTSNLKKTNLSDNVFIADLSSLWESRLPTPEYLKHSYWTIACFIGPPTGSQTFITRSDPFLLILRPISAGNHTEEYIAWEKANAVAKRRVILMPGEQVQVRLVVYCDDESKTTYELWEFLEST